VPHRGAAAGRPGELCLAPSPPPLVTAGSVAGQSLSGAAAAAPRVRDPVLRRRCPPVRIEDGDGRRWRPVALGSMVGGTAGDAR
jgi:hypothetical protein